MSMENTKETKHNETIIEQFKQQALTFQTVKGHYDSVDTIISMSEISNDETLLDIACGTGILTCEFAKHAKSVRGLDITQEMLTQAKITQKNSNLNNIHFDLGEVEHLPYKDKSFDIVFSRYSFHHFLNTKKVFDEMLRVCKDGGKIIVVDVALEEKYSLAYNSMEKLRDPSHTKALSLNEFHTLYSNPLLRAHKQSSYSVEVELENQLSASFPNKGDEDVLRNIFKKELSHDTLGMKTYTKEDKIYFSYPITIFSAIKE